MLNKKSLVLSFVAFATLAGCAMPTTTTKKASTDEALDVDRAIGATTSSKLSAISPEVKTLVDSIKTLSGKTDVTKDLDAMLKKNITTASCMTAPKAPQGAQVTAAPGNTTTPTRPNQGGPSTGPTTLTKGGINSRFENSFAIKQTAPTRPTGAQPTAAPGGQQGGSVQPPQDTNNGQQGRPPQGAPNGAPQGAPNGPMGNPPPQNAGPCAAEVGALVADLTAFEATLKAKAPSTTPPSAPQGQSPGGQQGGQQKPANGPQGQPANGPQGQLPKA